jgi:hypothetical protein
MLEYASVIAAGSVAPPGDYGMVASVDGCKFGDRPIYTLHSD